MDCLDYKTEIKIDGVQTVITKANKIEVIITCDDCGSEYYTLVSLSDFTPSN